MARGPAGNGLGARSAAAPNVHNNEINLCKEPAARRSCKPTDTSQVRWGRDMQKADNRALVRDTHDWLRELDALWAEALARRDFVRAEELRAEIAEVNACLDGILEATAEA